MFKRFIDGKLVIVKSSNKNIPSFEIIKQVYRKIPDNKHIPIVFETKKQYLQEYIKNQEVKKKVDFTPSQEKKYISTELKNMNNVVSRYTTKANPFIDLRTVFFTDKKITPKQFEASAYHEYAHEAWEKNPKIKRDWGAVNKTTAPTSYGSTDRQEDFAESYMLARMGKLRDPRRKQIISKDMGHSRVPWSLISEKEQVNAVASGKKPIAMVTKQASTNLPYYKTELNNPLYGTVTDYIYYRPETESRAKALKNIYESHETLSYDELTKVGKDPAFHTKVGKLLGYKNKEIGKFIAHEGLYSTPFQKSPRYAPTPPVTDLPPILINNSMNRRFDSPVKPRYPGREGFDIKWYPTEEVLKKHQLADPDNDITNPDNQIGNRLPNAIEFIKEKKFMTEDWPGGGIGGFEPPLVNQKGSISDGRHRLLALKNLGYTEIPVEEFQDDRDRIFKDKAKNMVWAKGIDAEDIPLAKGTFGNAGNNERAYTKKRVIMPAGVFLKRQYDQRPNKNSIYPFEKWADIDEYDRKRIDSMKQTLLDPKKELPVPIEEYDVYGKRRDFQEGRHRGIAAQELGMDVPVILARKRTPPWDRIGTDPYASKRFYKEEKDALKDTEWDKTIASFPEDIELDIKGKNALYEYNPEESTKDKDIYTSLTGSRIERTKSKGISPEHFPSVDDISYYYDNAPKEYSPDIIKLSRNPYASPNIWGSYKNLGGNTNTTQVSIYPKKRIMKWPYKEVKRILTHETGHKIEDEKGLIPEYEAYGLTPKESPSIYALSKLRLKNRDPEAKLRSAKMEDIAESFNMWHPDIRSGHVRVPSVKNVRRWSDVSGFGGSPTIPEFPLDIKPIESNEAKKISGREILERKRKEQIPKQKAIQDRMEFLNQSLGKEFKKGMTPREEYEMMESPEQYIEEGLHDEALREKFTKGWQEADHTPDLEKIEKIKSVKGGTYSMEDFDVNNDGKIDDKDIEIIKDNGMEYDDLSKNGKVYNFLRGALDKVDKIVGPELSGITFPKPLTPEEIAEHNWITEQQEMMKENPLIINYPIADPSNSIITRISKKEDL